MGSSHNDVETGSDSVDIANVTGHVFGSDLVESSPIFKRSRGHGSITPKPRNLFSESDTSMPRCSSSVQCFSSTPSTLRGDFSTGKSSLNNNKRNVENENQPSAKKLNLTPPNTLDTQVNLNKFDCPKEYDPSVWCDIPVQIKQEILQNLKPPMTLNPDTKQISIEVKDCPPNIDPHVFSELPGNIKKELILDYKANVTPKSKSSRNSIKNYFSPK